MCLMDTKKLPATHKKKEPLSAKRYKSNQVVFMKQFIFNMIAPIYLNGIKLVSNITFQEREFLPMITNTYQTIDPRLSQQNPTQ